jgi:hypothetical protein
VYELRLGLTGFANIPWAACDLRQDRGRAERSARLARTLLQILLLQPGDFDLLVGTRHVSRSQRSSSVTSTGFREACFSYISGRSRGPISFIYPPSAPGLSRNQIDASIEKLDHDLGRSLPRLVGRHSAGFEQWCDPSPDNDAHAGLIEDARKGRKTPAVRNEAARDPRASRCSAGATPAVPSSALPAACCHESTDPDRRAVARLWRCSRDPADRGRAVRPKWFQWVV